MNEPENAMTVGKRIRFERESRNWSQMGLGMRATCTPSQLSDYEHDKTKPNLDTIARIASVFEVSIDYLVTGKKQ